MSTSFEPNDVQTFDMLDDIRTKAILHANHRCRKLKMSKFRFLLKWSLIAGTRYARGNWSSENSGT
jgi:hypothetical protein